MVAAVGDVEADGSRYSLHQGKRLSIFGGAERKLFVPAAEQVAEHGAERRATQGKAATSTVMQVAVPAGLLLLIKPRPGQPTRGRACGVRSTFTTVAVSSTVLKGHATKARQQRYES